MKEYSIKKFMKIITLCVICLFLLYFFAFSFLLFTFFHERNSFWKSISHWQTIYFENIASFKVPEYWYVAYNDNFVYITDKPIDEEEHEILIIGVAWSDYSDIIGLYNLLGNDVKYIENSHGQIFSRGAGYSEIKFEIDEKIEIKQYIVFSDNSMAVEIINWGDLIDEEIMIKIVQSFRR